MTQKEFDNYKFGVNTIVKWDDEWHEVKGVDFEDRTVLVVGVWAKYTELEGIMEEKGLKQGRIF
jgi:hypothetical protein